MFVMCISDWGTSPSKKDNFLSPSFIDDQTCHPTQTNHETNFNFPLSKKFQLLVYNGGLCVWAIAQLTPPSRKILKYNFYFLFCVHNLLLKRVYFIYQRQHSGYDLSFYFKQRHVFCCLLGQPRKYFNKGRDTR